MITVALLLFSVVTLVVCTAFTLFNKGMTFFIIRQFLYRVLELLLLVSFTSSYRPRHIRQLFSTSTVKTESGGNTLGRSDIGVTASQYQDTSTHYSENDTDAGERKGQSTKKQIELDDLE